MTTYKVVLSEKARKALKKLDKNTALLITRWLRNHLEGCVNPRQHGKALTANHAGEWRYRIGDYRLIAQIKDDEIIILILRIGHRREIY